MKTEIVTGKIISSQKHSKTHVYSHGGGGYVGKYGGYVAAPQISSNVTTQHEIFVETDNGKEFSLILPIENVPLREGHKVSLVIAYSIPKNEGYYVALYNHSLERIFYFTNPATLTALGLYKKYSAWFYIILAFCLAVMVAVPAAILDSIFKAKLIAFAWPISILICVVFYFRRENKNKKSIPFIKEIINKTVNEIID